MKTGVCYTQNNSLGAVGHPIPLVVEIFIISPPRSGKGNIGNGFVRLSVRPKLGESFSQKVFVVG